MPNPSFGYNHTFEPVSPVNIVDGAKRPRGVGFVEREDEKQPHASTRSIRTNSTASSLRSFKTPRTARFAEATSVHSPVAGPDEKRSPFADPPNMTEPAAKPSDVGFGYISDQPVEQHATWRSGPLTPSLKSALKTPGTASKLNPLSPTFKEELALEKEEGKTEIQQAKDLVWAP